MGFCVRVAPNVTLSAQGKTEQGCIQEPHAEKCSVGTSSLKPTAKGSVRTGGCRLDLEKIKTDQGKSET